MRFYSYVAILAGVLSICGMALAQDDYEPDDVVASATQCYFGIPSQARTLHSATDEDWAYLYVCENFPYTFWVENPGSDLDAAFEFYEATDTVTPVFTIDDSMQGEVEFQTYIAQSTGKLFVRVFNALGNVPSEPEYDLYITRDLGIKNLNVVEEAGALRLTWEPPEGVEPDEYIIERSVEKPGGPFTYLDTIDGTTLTYLDDDVNVNITYYYVVSEFIGGNQAQLTEPVPGVVDVTEWRMY
jgi:hypothetical protein